VAGGMKVLLYVVLILAALQLALCWRRGRITTFSQLPIPSPESIAYGNGNFYTAHVQSTASVGQIAVTSVNGLTVKSITLTGTQGALTGIYYRSEKNDVLVCDSRKGRVVAVDIESETNSQFIAVPRNGSFVNDLTRDKLGNWYVTDSLLGVIWKANPDGTNVRVWSDNQNLLTNGSFGANGLAFSLDESVLYVNNVGGGKAYAIVKNSNGEAGNVSIFAANLLGNDALRVDANGNVWIVSNQLNEVSVYNPSGNLIAKFGDAEGVDANGVIRGLLGPASFVFYNGGVYFANFAPSPANDALASLKKEIKTWTIAKLDRFSLSQPFRVRSKRG